MSKWVRICFVLVAFVVIFGALASACGPVPITDGGNPLLGAPARYVDEVYGVACYSWSNIAISCVKVR